MVNPSRQRNNKNGDKSFLQIWDVKHAKDICNLLSMYIKRRLPKAYI